MSSVISATRPAAFAGRQQRGCAQARPSGVVRRATVCCAAADEELSTAALATAVAGLVANPICLWSEYTLKTTGSGLPADVAGGALGAAEGVSYLVIVGIVAWSLYTKKETGSGLPAGPSGLLGAAEGFSYLSLVAGLVVFGLNSAGL